MKRKGFILLLLLCLVCPAISGKSAAFTDTFQTDTGAIDTSGKDTAKKKVPLMQRIEKFALKDNLVSRFLRTFIVFNTPVQTAAPDTIQAEEKQFEKHEGKVIRNIHIYVLDPFGYTVAQPVCRQVTDLEKWGNRVHTSTRSWIVRNKLLFREGEKADAFKVSESERLLRSSGYINDANIVLVPTHKKSDTIDVYVYAQDVWSMGVGVSGDPLKPNGDVSFTDINFLGLGQRFESKWWYDPVYYNHWKYSGRYNVQEIGRTFTSAHIHYFTANRDRTFGIGLNRPFFSPIASWGGGLSVDFMKNYYFLEQSEGLPKEGYNHIQLQDGWLGYAFKPGTKNTLHQRKSQIVLSGRVVNRNFVRTGPLDAELDRRYPDEQTYLGSVALSFREYYRERFIFGFGRTEDVPMGYLLSLTGGVNRTNYYRRGYGGAKVSFGQSHSSLGYMATSLEAGGYLRSADSPVEQGVLAAQILYFTNMRPVGRWYIRHFLWNRFALGYNWDNESLLHINRGEGLRVFSSDAIRGTQKLVTNYEINFFTPYQPLGFRMVAVAFMDFALIGNSQNPLLNSRVFQGYGLGLRLKNERLIFNTFQLSLHYYPGMSIYGVDELRHNHTEHPFYRFQDFSAGQPYTVGL